MKKIFINILTALLLVSISVVHAGGGSRNGTGGAAQLLIPVGTQGIALSGSNVSSMNGIEALYWNPAGISRNKYGIEATFSHMSYIADIGVNYGAVSFDIEGFGVLAFSLKTLGVGDIDVTTVQNPDGTGQTYAPQLFTAGLTYARNLSDRVSVGLTGKLISEELGLVNTTGFAFDIGVMYTGLGGMDGLSFAIIMKNLGPQMKFAGSGLNVIAGADGYNRPNQYYTIEAASVELPSSLEIGFAYSPVINESNSLSLSSTFQNNNFAGDQYKIGAEYTYDNLLSLRGGYTLAPDYDKENFIYGFTAGFGINYDFEGVRLKFDYAFREVKYFDSSHVFAITFGL